MAQSTVRASRRRPALVLVTGALGIVSAVVAALLASLPGMLPLAALGVVWMEYHQDPSLLEAVAAIPVLTLVLTLTPPVRRWADPQPAAVEADRGRTGP